MLLRCFLQSTNFSDCVVLDVAFMQCFSSLCSPTRSRYSVILCLCLQTYEMEQIICLCRRNRRIEFNDQKKIHSSILNSIPCILEYQTILNKESKGSTIVSIRKEILHKICSLLNFSRKFWLAFECPKSCCT
jgi:hypothetical protein